MSDIITVWFRSVVNPVVLCDNSLTDIEAELWVITTHERWRRRIKELKLVLVIFTLASFRHGGAANMKIIITDGAVIGKWSSIIVASVAGENGLAVRQGEEEGDGVLRMRFVMEISWCIKTWFVQQEITGWLCAFESWAQHIQFTVRINQFIFFFDIRRLQWMTMAKMLFIDQSFCFYLLSASVVEFLINPFLIYMYKYTYMVSSWCLVFPWIVSCCLV